MWSTIKHLARVFGPGSTPTMTSFHEDFDCGSRLPNEAASSPRGKGSVADSRSLITESYSSKPLDNDDDGDRQTVDRGTSLGGSLSDESVYFSAVSVEIGSVHDDVGTEDVEIVGEGTEDDGGSDAADDDMMSGDDGFDDGNDREMTFGPIIHSTPIGVGGGGGNWKRGTGKRKKDGPEKMTGKVSIRWTKEERLWFFECMCWYRHLGMAEVAKRFNCGRYGPERGLPSLYAQAKVIHGGGGGLTEMEKDEIDQKVLAEKRRMVAEMEDIRWDKTFHGWWCDTCVTVVEGDEDEPQEHDVSEVSGDDEDGNERSGVVEEIDMGLDEDGFEDGEERRDMVEGDEEPVRRVEVVVERVDTWNEADGSVRPLTEEEKGVIELMRKVRDDGEWKEIPNMKSVPRKKLMKEQEVVNGLMHNLVSEGMTVTEVNRLLYVAPVVVAERLGLKVAGGKKAEQKKPHWQRRIERKIVVWRKDLSKVEEVRKGSNVSEKVRKVLDRRYELTERGAASVSTFLKGKIQAGSTKIRWFVEKKVARRQNRLFQSNQKQLYKELGGGVNGNTNDVPDATKSREFWEKIWSVETEHERDAVWLGEARKSLEHVEAMEDVEITVDDVLCVIRRMANWKAAGPDGVQGFWFKKLTSLHVVLTDALRECVASGVVPEWMTKGRTVLIQKDPANGTAVDNYRPIACLPLMWKLLTGIFAEKIYDHLHANRALPDEQKGCRKRSRGTKDQLLIDKAVLKEARLKKRCLAMAWIDYRKAYDMLPHSWILETLGLIKVAKNIEGLLRGSMASWKTVLTANGEDLGEVSIRRGIFQGDSLSPLLFVVAMIPLTSLLRREKMGYKFGKEGRKINHLLFMDDLKLYGSCRMELENLCAVVDKFSKDIRMEFGLKKCATVVMKDGVRERCDELVLPDGRAMQEVEEEGYKYLGVLETDRLMMKEMKGKVRKEYLRRVKAAAGSQLYAGKLLQAVNSWAVSVVRYTAGILDWTQEELEGMDTKTRKLLSVNGVRHVRSSVDRLYIKRKEGGRGLMSVEECVRREEAGLEEYVFASEEWMLKVVAENWKKGVETQEEYKKRMDKERKERLGEKKVHGKFFREVAEVADPRSWQWLSSGSLDKKKEGFICGAQENVLNTRYRVAMLKREGGKGRLKDGEGLCRKCGKFVETVGHLVSGCGMLSQREYRKRHDRVGLRVYWGLCGKYDVKRSERWYDEVPDPVRFSKDGRYEIRWDQTIPTSTSIAESDGTRHNKPDVVVIDKVGGRWTMIDFAVPFDRNVAKIETEKKTRYEKLAAAVRKEQKVRVDVVPVVVGALGVVSSDLVGYLVEELGVGDVVGELQTTALICTAAILTKILVT